MTKGNPENRQNSIEKIQNPEKNNSSLEKLPKNKKISSPTKKFPHLINEDIDNSNLPEILSDNLLTFSYKNNVGYTNSIVKLNLIYKIFMKI